MIHRVQTNKRRRMSAGKKVYDTRFETGRLRRGESRNLWSTPVTNRMAVDQNQHKLYVMHEGNSACIKHVCQRNTIANWKISESFKHFS